MKFLVNFLLVASGTVVVLGAHCPDGWTPHEDACFLYMKETYNWFDARAVCNVLSGYLAEDTSNSKHEFLRGLIQTHGATAIAVWIGLQDFAEESEFVWTYSGVSAQPTFWLPSEPQDAGGEEDCAAMRNGGWLDTNCEDTKRPFICETEATEDPPVG